MSKQYKEGDVVVLKGIKADYPHSQALTIGNTYAVHDDGALFIKDSIGDDVDLYWLILDHFGEPPCPLCVKHEVKKPLKKQLKKAEKKVLKLKAKLKGLS